MYPNNFMTPPNTGYGMGGYPGYGYPPSYPNYGNGMSQMIPGINTPIEATFKDGTTVTIPPQQQFQQPQPMMGVYNPPMYQQQNPYYPQPQVSYPNLPGSGSNPVNPNTVNTGYIQGGATVNQGGYDPVTKTFTQPSATQGYNPFMSAVNNPTNTNQLGFEPYDPSKRTNNVYYSAQTAGLNQYNFYNYYNRTLYSQNPYNYDLQEILYEDAASVDPASIMEKVLGKEAVQQPQGYVVGYDYYGAPIYSNPQYGAMMGQKRQEEFEKARNNQINIFTTLARNAAVYLHQDFDEEKARKYFDPVKEQPKPKQFNYATASPEEKQQYEEYVENRAVIDVCNFADTLEAQMPQRFAWAEQMHQKIKDSHDRALGFEPGTNYTLNQFLDNAYTLRIQSAQRDAKKRSKVGYDKYSTNNFRASLAKESNAQIPIQSKDDEYVSIEELLKRVYERNKKEAMTMNTPRPTPSYGSTNMVSRVPENAPPIVTTEGVVPQTPEIDAHNRFMLAMQNSKQKNDVRLYGR